MARLSVLLPCRDAARFLPRAIASIQRQTYRDFEVIAIDDGSRDDSPALLDAWAARDARVHVVRTAANGIVCALESGRSIATGGLIARMDADDVAHPQRFAMQVALLDDRPDIDACGTRVRYFPRSRVKDGALMYERWINALVEPDDIARDIFVECPLPHPTLAVRSRVLEAVGGWRDAGWAEDYDLVFRMWNTGCRMAKVPRVLLAWRERPDRLSRTAPQYSHDAFRRCKVAFLLDTLARDRPLLVGGSGSTGKLFAREAVRHGAALAGFVDVDPRKIGQVIHGVPVVPPARIAEFRGAYGVAAVASSRARGEIRAAFRSAGWGEMQDFCAVA